MRIFFTILFLAAMLTTALFSFGMTAAAIKYRKLRYDPSGSPIIFSAQPLRFVLSCMVLVVFGCASLFVGVFTAIYLYRLL
jgi:hypothetical protein